mgnify:CR=1 FL=1
MSVKFRKKELSFGYALFIIAAILGIIIILGAVFQFRMQAMFLLAWLLAILLCLPLGFTYDELQKGMFDFMPRCLLPVVFMITIGGLIGVWNASGTIAYVTYLGLNLINPNAFLVTSFLISLAFALVTGTSWGTVGSIGIALFGVGLGMNFNPLIAASAIISGAYIGDGLSPMSDTTNIISGSLNIDLFDHVRCLMKIGIPTIIISAIIYLIMGLSGTGGDISTSEVPTIMEGIAANFNLGIITLLPIILVLVLLFIKVKTIPALLCGIASGILISTFHQGWALKDSIQFMWAGFSMNSGNSFIDSLFNRGGMTSVTSTVVMVIMAFGLFGILNTAGVLDKVVEPLVHRIHSYVGGAVCTLLFGCIANLSSSTTFAYLFCCNMLGEVYDKVGLDRKELANAVMVGCLPLGLWVPWNTNAATPAASLGIDPGAVAPLLVIPYVYIVVLLVVSFIKQTRLKNKQDSK